MPEQERLILLNLGCGQRFHPDWVNIDYVSYAPQVRAYDLSSGIPLETNSCDAVYHSHVLEHFSRAAGEAFIQECFRVLKPGGILRVVVPDLEVLAKQYLLSLQACRGDNNPMNIANHQWAVIELIDQMVRTRSGGEMAAYWRQPNILNEDTLTKRLGHEFTAWRSAFLQQQVAAAVAPPVSTPPASILRRLRTALRRYRLKRAGLQESQWQSLQFLHSGEKHLWMYDALSLSRLLSVQGFDAIQVTDARNSLIPRWEDYRMLDVEAGAVRKPDSLFMEAVKPPDRQEAS